MKEESLVFKSPHFPSFTELCALFPLLCFPQKQKRTVFCFWILLHPALIRIWSDSPKSLRHPKGHRRDCLAWHSNQRSLWSLQQWALKEKMLMDNQENLSDRRVRRVHSQWDSFDPCCVFEFLNYSGRIPVPAVSVVNLRISLCAQMGIVSHLYTFWEETIYCSAVFHFKLNQSPSVHLEVQTTLRLPSTLAQSSQNYTVSIVRLSVTPSQRGTVSLFQSTQSLPDSIHLNNWCLLHLML